MKRVLSAEHRHKISESRKGQPKPPGSGSRPGVPRSTPEARFLTKFLVGDDCWEWTGGCWQDGYGMFWVQAHRSHAGPRRAVRAHRFAYELFVGPLPSDLTLHHVCGLKTCVNPTHLEPMSRPDHASLHREATS